jgi:hypothetical protein
MKKISFLDNFWLKIIAIITMTIDHIGVFLYANGMSVNYETIYSILRIVGRISMPIFVFLLIEGVRHSKNLDKYLLRLGIFALTVYIPITIYDNIINIFQFSQLKNIFVTLFLLVLSYRLLNFKNKRLHILVIIPILYLVAGGLYEFGVLDMSLKIKINIDGLMPQYSIFAAFLFFYRLLFDKLYTRRIFKIFNKDQSLVLAYKTSEDYLQTEKLIYITGIIILSLASYLFSYLTDGDYSLYLTMETYSIIAFLPILLYNGKLGYYNKFIKYGFYAYYPIHIALLALIFMLV